MTSQSRVLNVSTLLPAQINIVHLSGSSIGFVGVNVVAREKNMRQMNKLEKELRC